MGPIDSTSGMPVTTFPKVNGNVFASAPDGSGGFYIGGEFTGVGGIDRKNIAHILPGGTLDTSWNPNCNSTVHALAISGSNVYAGGEFTSIGGVTRNNIAAINDSTGQPTSWNPNCNEYVLAIAVSGSTVYAGGEFETMGLLPCPNFAIFKGTTPNPCGTGSSPATAVFGLTLGLLSLAGSEGLRRKMRRRTR